MKGAGLTCLAIVCAVPVRNRYRSPPNSFCCCCRRHRAQAGFPRVVHGLGTVMQAGIAGSRAPWPECRRVRNAKGVIPFVLRSGDHGCPAPGPRFRHFAPIRLCAGTNNRTVCQMRLHRAFVGYGTRGPSATSAPYMCASPSNPHISIRAAGGTSFFYSDQ